MYRNVFKCIQGHENNSGIINLHKVPMNCDNDEKFFIIPTHVKSNVLGEIIVLLRHLNGDAPWIACGRHGLTGGNNVSEEIEDSM